MRVCALYVNASVLALQTPFFTCLLRVFPYFLHSAMGSPLCPKLFSVRNNYDSFTRPVCSSYFLPSAAVSSPVFLKHFVALRSHRTRPRALGGHYSAQLFQVPSSSLVSSLSAAMSSPLRPKVICYYRSHPRRSAFVGGLSSHKILSDTVVLVLRLSLAGHVRSPEFVC